MTTKKEDYRLWLGRSSGELSKIAIEIGESISLDKELYREDIQGSLIHAKMLNKIGILKKEELKKIQSGLTEIKNKIEEGNFTYDISLEDIHTHIEKNLIEICGDAGRRLHTARSRNDQIALDTHLYVIARSRHIANKILILCQTLFERASENIGTLIPGYTHLQIAQPIRLSHHLLAHFWAFIRDLKRYSLFVKNADYLPLGSGAFAGVNYETDREFLRKELGFSNIYPNSIDAVSSRDHILDFIYASSTFMAHASRVAEEIILWHSQEFSFLELPDSLTTGSSIMPQKKNPDLAELIRGKTGRVQSNLYNLFTVIKALPMAYNRDLQEDRFPLLDTYKQTLLCVIALEAMLKNAKYDPKKCKEALEKGYASATDIADALVIHKNMSFRDAHHYVGALVSYCVSKNIKLEEVGREKRKEICHYFEDDKFYFSAIHLETSVEKKKSYGSTSLKAQKVQLGEAKKELKKWENYKWPKIMKGY